MVHKTKSAVAHFSFVPMGIALIAFLAWAGQAAPYNATIVGLSAPIEFSPEESANGVTIPVNTPAYVTCIGLGEIPAGNAFYGNNGASMASTTEGEQERYMFSEQYRTLFPHPFVPGTSVLDTFDSLSVLRKNTRVFFFSVDTKVEFRCDIGFNTQGTLLQHPAAPLTDPTIDFIPPIIPPTTLPPTDDCPGGSIDPITGVCDNGVPDPGPLPPTGFCGDGVQDPGEECDLGGVCSGGAFINTPCQIGDNSMCGAGWECIPKNPEVCSDQCEIIEQSSSSSEPSSSSSSSKSSATSSSDDSSSTSTSSSSSSSSSTNSTSSSSAPSSSNSSSSMATVIPDCHDSIDNDNDGHIDYTMSLRDSNSLQLKTSNSYLQSAIDTQRGYIYYPDQDNRSIVRVSSTNKPVTLEALTINFLPRGVVIDTAQRYAYVTGNYHVAKIDLDTFTVVDTYAGTISYSPISPLFANSENMYFSSQVFDWTSFGWVQELRVLDVQTMTIEDTRILENAQSAAIIDSEGKYLYIESADQNNEASIRKYDLQNLDANSVVSTVLGPNLDTVVLDPENSEVVYVVKSAQSSQTVDKLTELIEMRRSDLSVLRRMTLPSVIVSISGYPNNSFIHNGYLYLGNINRSAIHRISVREWRYDQTLELDMTAVLGTPKRTISLLIDTEENLAYVNSLTTLYTVDLGDPECRSPEDREDGTVGTPAVCGDGVITEGEECDDGNLVSGDGCGGEDHPYGACSVEFCGDAYVDTDGVPDPNGGPNLWAEECDVGGVCADGTNDGAPCRLFDDHLCGGGVCILEEEVCTAWCEVIEESLSQATNSVNSPEPKVSPENSSPSADTFSFSISSTPDMSSSDSSFSSSSAIAGGVDCNDAVDNDGDGNTDFSMSLHDTKELSLRAPYIDLHSAIDTKRGYIYYPIERSQSIMRVSNTDNQATPEFLSVNFVHSAIVIDEGQNYAYVSGKYRIAKVDLDTFSVVDTFVGDNHRATRIITPLYANDRHVYFLSPIYEWFSFSWKHQLNAVDVQTLEVVSKKDLDQLHGISTIDLAGRYLYVGSSVKYGEEYIQKYDLQSPDTTPVVSAILGSMINNIIVDPENSEVVYVVKSARSSESLDTANELLQLRRSDLSVLQRMALPDVILPTLPSETNAVIENGYLYLGDRNDTSIHKISVRDWQYEETLALNSDVRGFEERTISLLVDREENLGYVNSLTKLYTVDLGDPECRSPEDTEDGSTEM